MVLDCDGLQTVLTLTCVCTGKFQLNVIPEAGHFIQEDVPDKTAQLMVEFFKRNDRSAMVLPPKVSDLIAQGKKV